MLLALILRGVAFEFRLSGRKRGKAFWTAAFTAGSLTATVAQGLVLGGFIQGVTLKNGRFAGGPFDWLTPYSLLVAVGLLAGYALLGACWLVWKTEDELHGRARRWAWIAVACAAILLAATSVATLFVHPRVAARWGFHDGTFDLHRLMLLAPIPALGLAGLLIVVAGLRRRSHGAPFLPPHFDLTTPSGIAALNHEVTRQAAMIGYIDDFALMLIVILASLPLLLLVRVPRRQPVPAAADDSCASVSYT